MSTSRTKSLSIDQQMGTLLAFIILFEKKIEQLRIKLAGNQQFHSRLAFQLLDKRRKCVVSAEDLSDAINRYSSSKSVSQVEAFCRKYTSNGAFSYDEFIKFLTPRTNKGLAQRLMIRTYRTGAQLPGYVISLLLQVLESGVSMLSITESIRKQIQQSTQLTHIQILQFFKKCCSSKQKLFYFINASTEGQGDYDFTLQEMKYLTFHVKGNCEIEDLGDHQIKEILYPIDMNYQKTFYNATMTNGFNDVKNRTDYFKTKTALNKTNEAAESSNKTGVNFLKTNYRQTSKGGFYNVQKDKFQSKEIFSQPLQQNVQIKSPTAMNYTKNFPNGQQQSVRFANNYQNNGAYLIPSQQRFSQQPNDVSEVSSLVNYGNLYIQKFARGPSQEQQMGGSRSNNGNNRNTGVRELDSFLFEKYEMQKRKEVFNDEFRRRGDVESSDDISDNSAFMQY